METNKKLFTIFAIILALLMAVYIGLTTMPIIEYATSPEASEVEGEITLMQYLWKPYKYPELMGDHLPNVFRTQFDLKYDITSTIAIPLFAFVGAIVSILVILLFAKKSFSIFFPIIWSLVSIVGYLTAPFLQVIFAATKTAHLILFGITLIVAMIAFFVCYLPQIRYNYEHREKY